MVGKAAEQAGPSFSEVLKEAVGRDWKGKTSMVLYVAAVTCAFWVPLVSHVIYVAVALIWLIPDRRIERKLARGED